MYIYVWIDLILNVFEIGLICWSCKVPIGMKFDVNWCFNKKITESILIKPSK